MKQLVVTWNFGRGSRRLRQLLVTGKMFALLSLGTMVMVVSAGVGAIVHQSTSNSPISSMKGFAANVPGELFSDMLAMEMAGKGNGEWKSAIDGKQASAFLVRLLTDINPEDPKSLLAPEFPGIHPEKAVILRPGSTADANVEPKDHGRIPAISESDTGGDNAWPPLTPDEVAKGDDTPSGGQVDPPAGEGTNPSVGGEAPSTETKPPAKSPTDKSHVGQPTTGGEKVVFIYHSHNRESWFPELKEGTKDPTSATKNITLLGKRLSEKLSDQGIGALTSSTDYPTAIKKYDWVLSYKYSKKTVMDAMAGNKKLTYFFDIHRDSQPKKYTTATINGKSYAKVMFIVGQGNPNWRKNESFANQIHAALEKDYPGISRGIWGKTAANGNGEYNQSLSPNSIVVEVGGIDNTLEESYRTIDALAKVIAKHYWNAEKVIAPKAS